MNGPLLRMLGHASAAMTLDVYADLFDSNLDSVADNVAKLWPNVVRLQSNVATETADAV